MSPVYLLLLGLLLAVLSNATTNTTCGEGFIMMANGACVDEDVCKNKIEVCGNNSVCNNTIGGYYCQCETGYQNNKKLPIFTAINELKCKDINECTENKTICGPNAKCNNIVGSYFCVCAEGFVASNKQERFNGSQNVTCNDIDECTSARRICGNNAVCHNTYGSYYCICVSGRDAFTNQEGSHTCTDESLRVSDVEFLETSVFCTHAETSNGYQHFNPSIFTFLPLILCILMFSHIYIS